MNVGRNGNQNVYINYVSVRGKNQMGKKKKKGKKQELNIFSVFWTSQTNVPFLSAGWEKGFFHQTLFVYWNWGLAADQIKLFRLRSKLRNTLNLFKQLRFCDCHTLLRYK